MSYISNDIVMHCNVFNHNMWSVFYCNVSLCHKGIVHTKMGHHFWGTIDFHCILFPTMDVNGAPKEPNYKLSSKYLPLCSAEQRHSNRFVTSWRWINDDRIVIFGWTVPLSILYHLIGFKEVFVVVCSSTLVLALIELFITHQSFLSSVSGFNMT